MHFPCTLTYRGFTVYSHSYVCVYIYILYECNKYNYSRRHQIMSIVFRQTYMAPSLSIFGDFSKDSSIMYNNFRVYGTILLVVMSSIVYVGVKFVNKFASVALACVLLSIMSVYAGIFYNFHGSDKL